ncbi:hypothetical protein B0H17DRAFT_435406 [Mycena rosella]|uniref:Uncharacterized protein n=1 Tax=Mycena rosella TaxID=1033263 RepID=A0AAD7FXJ9_MYCRO|nr:hypothetical protein B0H17DRAFT_435406 [Mycena rosella]
MISVTNDSFVACQYGAAGNCEYFSPGGQFSAGSSACPDSITPGAASSGSPDLAQCVATDDLGSAFQGISATGPGEGFVTCQYEAAGSCVYFTGGQFSAGSSTCPDSITPASSSGANDGLTESGPSLAKCAESDDAGSVLQSSGTTNHGFVTCQYQNAGNCEYLTPGGEFSGGSSTCPDSITPGSGSAAAGALGGAFAADVDNSGSNSGSGTSTLSQPVVIALLVMNAVLVIGGLILGTLWVRGGRENRRSSQLRGLYASVDASRDTTVPLTYGTQGTYYDGPDAKVTSRFES